MQIRSFAATVEPKVEDSKWSTAKPYSAIPGPKPLPLLGNTWRFVPIIGKHYKMVSYCQLLVGDFLFVFCNIFHVFP